MRAAETVLDGLSREAVLGRQIAALDRELKRAPKPKTRGEWIARFRLEQKVLRLRFELKQLSLFG